MTHREAAQMSPGVLSNRQLEILISSGAIGKAKFDAPKTGPSAVDLRLGRQAWVLREGQRPTTRELHKIKALGDVLALQKDDHGEYFDFEAKKIYLIQLDQFLELPANISGRATGKSSIGRLDVITRLITSQSREYDVVRSGYVGELYLLLLPQTFGIRVAPGDSLNQLRLFSGAQSDAVISTRMVASYGTPFWHILGSDGVSYDAWDALVHEVKEYEMTSDPQLFDLTVDLADPDSSFVFRAKRDVASPIDLRKPVYGEGYDYESFFDKVKIDSSDRSVALEVGSFYIMKSRERLSIPDDVAVEVVAISERIGDIRIHYAGFAHPGFGRTRTGADGTRRGTPLIFEVRATDMTTKLYHQSIIARIQLFRVSGIVDPETEGPYERQELRLSKVFKG